MLIRADSHANGVKTGCIEQGFDITGKCSYAELSSGIRQPCRVDIAKCGNLHIIANELWK
ncbi:hypothetical protein D3C81_1893560 [compost metagenome]